MTCGAGVALRLVYITPNLPGYVAIPQALMVIIAMLPAGVGNGNAGLSITGVVGKAAIKAAMIFSAAGIKAALLSA